MEPGERILHLGQATAAACQHHHLRRFQPASQGLDAAKRLLRQAVGNPARRLPAFQRVAGFLAHLTRGGETVTPVVVAR